ncbi:MAG: hypothetical protein RLZZ262_689 [Bacteroidota bacterium]|jgi:hypothetical protein
MDVTASLKQYGFFLRGISGQMVMFDRTWYQDPRPDGNGGWTRSYRTMSGNELTTTVITYSKKPTSVDMYKGAAMIVTFVQLLTYDQVMVPITWVDENKKPASAPVGLENITKANGCTGEVIFANATPLNWKMTFGLNYIKFGGSKGWKCGCTKNLLPYFQSFGKMKGCVVVDDRTNIASVYDGISTDPHQYPTLMPNYIPHSGPLNGVKF